ncbi:hypothetical protein CDV31_003992 [Fusarium ambrosium]|uniref:Uncharacterized protein n=1 Tax=Fusarium ambrosium TaxID=131363 RepID=A0A428US39_9HYPO|nr:hypothetical protein CDV31_003992 [Fusarium ambrosium]
MNMVAIAGAIIAQIAITGLSLEAMSQAHWTAAAFLVVSLIFGLISVYVAFIVQQELNGLLGSGGFADWLTLTPSAQELPSNRYSSSRHPAVPQTQESSQPRTEAVPRAEHSPVDLHLQREPSALAAIMMATPSGLLGLSLNAFIFGLGIYLGSAYTGNLVPDFGKGGSLGILIFYIVAATTGTFLYMFPRLLKSSETQG